MKNKIVITTIFALLAGLQACDWPSGTGDSAVVRGEVSYLQRIALPDSAVLIVQLEDVSPAENATHVLAEREIELKGRQVPVDFELPYDRNKTDPEHRYALAARIEDDSGLRFMTTELHGVSLAEPEVEVSIVVDPVISPNDPDGGGPMFSCQGNEPFWHLDLSPGVVDLKQLKEQTTSRRYEGAYIALFGPDGDAFYEWQGQAEDNARLKLRVLPGHCQDSMASAEEGGLFEYSGSVYLAEEQLRGCCRMTSVTLPQPTEIYACDDDSEVAVIYYEEGNSSQVRLQLEDGSERLLNNQISASGTKFGDGETIFWLKGNEATLELDGAEAMQCRLSAG